MNVFCKLFIIAISLTTGIAFAQEAADTKAATKKIGANEQSIESLERQIQQQKEIIGSQQKDMASQETRILNQQQQLSTQSNVLENQGKQIESQQQQLETQTEYLNNLQSQIDRLNTNKEKELSEEDLAMRQRLEKLETQVGQLPEDPSTILADENFPGAIRVPGTTAAFKIGGYAKAALVKNFDPLVTQDQFIVGSIPVTANDATGIASETSLTANQTRMNFDYRQQSEAGTLRAFIEGDFAGDNDTFRLRHAFGQFRDVLAGKTWSAFYDSEAAPEEVDFEGINGRVVVRQTQIRYFPQIGKDWRWMISLEDPQPQVTGGTGVSDIPDIVSSIRRDWFNRWHLKTAVILRQIRAVTNDGVTSNGQACDPTTDADCTSYGAFAGNEESAIGWGVTVSGKINAPWWNKNDNILFQFNGGDGLGRYINDLSSVSALEIDGGQDAVISSTSGKISTLPVFGGYLAYQHWWKGRLRSTALVSLVSVDNVAAQNGDAYHQTFRTSINLIWSPIKNIDLGAEVLWGKRVNKDDRSGTATQLQLEAIYRF